MIRIWYFDDLFMSEWGSVRVEVVFIRQNRSLECFVEEILPSRCYILQFITNILNAHWNVHHQLAVVILIVIIISINMISWALNGGRHYFTHKPPFAISHLVRILIFIKIICFYYNLPFFLIWILVFQQFLYSYLLFIPWCML